MPLYQLFGGRVREGVPVCRHADGSDLEDKGCAKILRGTGNWVSRISAASAGIRRERYGVIPETAPKVLCQSLPGWGPLCAGHGKAVCGIRDKSGMTSS